MNESRNRNKISGSISKINAFQIRQAKESRTNTGNCGFHYFLNESCVETKIRRNGCCRIRLGSNRKRIWRSALYVRCSTDSSGDERSDRKIAATDRCLPINTEMRVSAATIASGGGRNIVKMSVWSGWF